MEFFKANPRIPFMKQRWIAAVISGVIFIASLISLAVNGLNLVLDFTGGTQAEVGFTQTISATELREQLVKAGFSEAVVQAYTKNETTEKTESNQHMFSVR